MKIFGQLRNLIFSSRGSASKKYFTYPYADDIQIKREQIWNNLQKGILLEDKGIFVPWFLSYTELSVIAEQRRERADRTEWGLGSRRILDGYEANLELMRWKFKPDDGPIKRVSQNLGEGDEGERKFNFLRRYLTDLLGEPTEVDLQKFGSLDIGSICWEREGIQLALVGIEHFSLRYTFYIGLKITNGVY